MLLLLGLYTMYVLYRYLDPWGVEVPYPLYSQWVHVAIWYISGPLRVVPMFLLLGLYTYYI